MRNPIHTDVMAQLARLELEESEISSRRRKLHDRIAIFPSPALLEAERELSLRRRDLHRRIDEKRAELAAARDSVTVEQA